MFENVGAHYYNTGLELLKKDRISEGIKYFEKAVEFGISNSSCYNLLGLCFFSLGKFAQGKYFWEKSIEVDDNFDNPAHSYISYLKASEFEKIVQGYNTALKHLEIGEYKQALAIFKKSNLLSINCVLFYNFYGLCLYALGESKKAQNIWIKSLKIDISNENTLYYISKIEEDDERGLLAWIRNKIRF